jgi:glycosyltransferase involved in cell wall biosynthesis
MPKLQQTPSVHPRIGYQPVRVAHLVSHPIQYFAPLYRELALRPEIDLTVYFYSDVTAHEFYCPEFKQMIWWDIPLLEGYRARFFPSAMGKSIDSGFLRRPNWDIIREVASRYYDVVWVHGYAHLTAWFAAAAARASGATVLIREEQTLLDHRPWYRQAAKEVALRALFSLASGLYIGEQNRRYFEYYGMPPSRLFPSRYCVDNRFFRKKAAELAPKRKEIRAAFGITDDAPVVLFCGKFIQKKQPLLLLETFERVRRQKRCWLLMVGDGPLRPAAEGLVKRRQIPNVLMPGFLNQTELPAAYTAADIFALPSAFQETWGLVVNEAMNFSLPIVVSDRVGCAEDLVRPGWNGFIVAHQDTERLAGAIATLVTDEEMRRTLGARSLQLIREYSIAACADGIITACPVRGEHRTQARSKGCLE